MAAIKPRTDNTFLFENMYHNDPAHASQQYDNHAQKFFAPTTLGMNLLPVSIVEQIFLTLSNLTKSLHFFTHT